MMERCFSRWDFGKNINVAELRREALEEIAYSKLEDDAILNDDDFFSDDDSFFDSADENKFECMDDDVLIPNICERHITSESFESTTKNGSTFGKQCSNEWLYVNTSRPVLACRTLANG